MKTIQIACITSVDTIEHSEAMRRTHEVLSSVRPVADQLLIRPAEAPVVPGYTGRHIGIGVRLDLLSYSWFCVRRLARYVTADHVLLVQADGFAVNADKWDEQFLDYDYIGAPWPPGLTFGNRVGNGGFTLLSRRFLELSAIGPEYEHGTGADVWWCQVAERYFHENGMTYAPIDAAARFSIENWIPEFPDRSIGDCFGQHAQLKIKVTPKP